MARVTTVKTSINSNTSEAVTVDSTSWSTDSGTITLSSAVPAAVKVGDVIADSGTNSYLITGISGSVLTCQDFDTITDPVTGNATISEAYATITLWEADLDSGTNSQVYIASDDAQGECYGVFDESLAVDGGATIGLSSITLTVPLSERHDGTAGSGARLVRTNNDAITLDWDSTLNSIFEWFELDGNGFNIRRLLKFDAGGVITGILSNMLLHGPSVSRTGDTELLLWYSSGISNISNILNNLLYDFTNSNTGGTAGLHITGLSAMTAVNVLNNTFHAIRNSSTGTAYGLKDIDEANRSVRNNIITDTSSGGTAQDYELSAPSNATYAYNLSSDATASGTGSLTNKTSANQFVSNSAPYDLHLKTGADAIDAGTDLVTTPSGVEIDIDGWNRDSDTPSRDPWDMGAHEFEAVAVGGINQIIGGGILV